MQNFYLLFLDNISISWAYIFFASFAGMDDCFATSRMSSIVGFPLPFIDVACMSLNPALGKMSYAGDSFHEPLLNWNEKFLEWSSLFSIRTLKTILRNN